MQCERLINTTGMGLGPGTMGLHIIPLTVHTPPRLGTGQGMRRGTNWTHTHIPVPVPIPVQCECDEP